MVELTEEHDPATLDEALALGVRLWGQQRYFEAHECLEHVWHQAAAPDREFWKGVIQVAVGAVHVQRDNPDGAVTLWNRAAGYLSPYPSPHHGVDTAALRDRARADAALVAAEGTTGVALPVLPVTPVGPFVGADPDAPDEPLDRVPPWAPRRALDDT